MKSADNFFDKYRHQLWFMAQHTRQEFACLMTLCGFFAIREPLPGTSHMPGSGGGRIALRLVGRDRKRV